MSREPKDGKPSERTNGAKVPRNGSGTSATPQQQSNRRRNRGTGEFAEWSSVDASKLLAVIDAVTQHGYAIRFGYTKDGGAYAVGILGDGDPFTEFIRPTEDIGLYLDGLISDYEK